MPSLFVIGNPLLDLQVRDGQQILEKFNLKANDAVLADDKQLPIYDYVRENCDVAYVAGGAAQNAARAAQYCLPEKSVVYTGSVGSDELAEQLNKANAREGLRTEYQVQPKDGESTGACAVVITGHDRSLCTKLAAAEKFNISHLSGSTVKPLIEEASHFYMEGFFLTHGLESALHLAQHSSQNNKTFAMNLSAPFIAQFFSSQIDQVLPHLDIVFGNESEAEAYAKAHDWDSSDLKAVAQKIADSKKENSSKPRIVAITHGSNATIVAQTGGKEAKTFPVEKVAESDIVDTNAAGDAFAGAFTAAIVSGRDIDQAVEAGHKMARMCIGQVGATWQWPKVSIL